MCQSFPSFSKPFEGGVDLATDYEAITKSNSGPGWLFLSFFLTLFLSQSPVDHPLLLPVIVIPRRFNPFVFRFEL